MKKRLSLMMVVLLLSLSVLAGCSTPIAKTTQPATDEAVALAEEGTLIVSVNPKLELTFDENGIVRAIEGLNDDGKEILNGLTQKTGLQTRLAVIDIVKAIIDKGYISLDDDDKHIELEIKEGSILPGDDFMKTIVTELQAFLKDNQLDNTLVVEDDSNYGVGDFGQSDYEVRKEEKIKAGKIKLKLDGSTKDDDTDYDGVDTNYDDSDYDDVDSNYDDVDSNYDDVDSNYDDTDYDGVDTNYDDSPYEPAPAPAYDDSDYDDSPYEPAPAPAPAPAPVDDDSDYGDSDYDDSGYDDSDYDD